MDVETKTEAVSMNEGANAIPKYFHNILIL